MRRVHLHVRAFVGCSMTRLKSKNHLVKVLMRKTVRRREWSRVGAKKRMKYGKHPTLSKAV